MGDENYGQLSPCVPASPSLTHKEERDFSSFGKAEDAQRRIWATLGDAEHLCEGSVSVGWLDK